MLKKFHRRLESSPSRVGTPNPNVKHKAVTAWHRVGGGVEYL